MDINSTFNFTDFTEAFRNDKDHSSGDYKAANDVNLLLWISAIFVFPITGTIGLVVNTLAIYVLLSQKRKSSTEVLLLGLSAADFLLAVTWLVIYIPESLFYCSTVIRYEEFPLREFFETYSFAVREFPIYLSKLITSAVGIERAFAIIKPIKFRLMLHKRLFASVVVVVCTLLACIEATLLLILPKRKITSLLPIIYMGVVYIVVVISTVLSIYGLNKYRFKSLEICDTTFAKHSFRIEVRATKILLGMAILFIVCNILPLLLTISHFTDFDTFADHCLDMTQQSLITMAIILEGVYSFANTFLMILAKESYKDKWMSIFKCKDKKKPSVVKSIA